jgi:hypothetical protein
MYPHVAFGMKLGRLLDPLHGGYLGQDLLEQAGFVEKLEAITGASLNEDPDQFVTDALRSDSIDLGA